MQISVSVQKKLKDFNLDIKFSSSQKRIGVFGPSGSGKSSLLNMLTGSTRPDHGKIELDSETIFCSEQKVNLPPNKRRITVVFQNAYLFPHLSVRQNLMYGYRRAQKQEKQLDFDKLVASLELSGLLNREIGNLSGGERQRVAIGRSVLYNPKLLLLDEPFSGLDNNLKYQIIAYLRQILGNFKTPTIFVSHSIEEMRLMSDSVYVLEEGKIVTQKKPEDLALEKMLREEGEYLNLISVKDPIRVKDLFHYKYGTENIITWFQTKQTGVIQISSDDIMLLRDPIEAISARNRLECTVSRVFSMKNRVGVELLSSGGKLIAKIMQEAAHEIGLKPGQKVYAVMKASSFKKIL